MSKTEVITLGCRLNSFESEVISALERSPDDRRDMVVLNSCAVTAEAERQTRQAVRKLRKERPQAFIVVAGCAAQLNPEIFADMPEVDQILGNTEKLDLRSYQQGGARLQVSPLTGEPATPEAPVTSFADRSRAFIQIQQGCDHQCTFCIVPTTRGPSSDVSPESLIKQIRRTIENGHQEVVLTGVDIASHKMGLGALAARILSEVTELKRLRLSTVDPAVWDAPLIRLFAEEERLMPHLHLSLQSGDDIVLKRMRRRHTVRQAMEFVQALRKQRPDLVLGADLIAGFPTETDQMAARTEQTVDALGLVHLHVFPYSVRPGTPAANMPQIPVNIRKARAAALRDLGAKQLTAHLQNRIGSIDEVLIEEGAKGRCRDYTPVRIDGPADNGEVMAVRLGPCEGELLIAEAA